MLPAQPTSKYSAYPFQPILSAQSTKSKQGTGVKRIGGNAFLNRFLFLFCREERRKKMECPVCKNAFSKAGEILLMVNRSFYCIHCWSRLVSYPDGEEGVRVKKDWMGDKWRTIEKQLANPLQDKKFFTRRNEGGEVKIK
jgi:hypothetical protein